VKQFLKDYFTFNKGERNGVFILSSIILLLISFFYIYPYFQDSFTTDFSEFDSEIEAFISDKKKVSDSIALIQAERQAKKFENHATGIEPEMFPFDPNLVSEEEMFKLGLKPFLVKTILNYREKGGRFFKKEDFGKIYGVSDSLFNAVSPFIIIPILESEPKNTNETFKKEIKDKTLLWIELNTADSTELIKVKGIGPAFSSRIIKYRNRLGGFLDVGQLLEVYGFSPELFESVQSSFYANIDAVRKININTCSAEELKNHPYINNWNIANVIVNYRKNHGPYKRTEEIRKTDLVNEEIYLKIAPYLTTGQD
jgi:competence protein ComEA